MKTTTLTLMLTLIIHVMVRGQIKLNNSNVLAVRVQKTMNLQPAEETSQVIRLNKEIKTYDEQIAELQKQKAKLNTEINTLFEGKVVAQNEVDEESSLGNVEARLKQSVRLYMENTKTLKTLLSQLSDRSIVTNAVADDLAEACKLAQSSQYMKEEAYSLSTEQSKVNMLGNSLEKMKQARMKQEAVIRLLEEPSGPSVLCLNKK